MLIWLLFAVLTAAVVAGVLMPMSGRFATPSQFAENADLAVYRDQLAEVDADLERGVIGPEEAKAARTEISRKILDVAGVPDEKQAADDATATPPDASAVARMTATWITPGLAGGIPLMAAIIYVSLGAPSLPDRPHAPRLKQDLKSATAANLLARVEARLREHPEDGKGWEVIAPFYLRARRYDDAAHAYRKAAQLLGETPPRLIGYAKAAIFANNGVVTEEVRKISETLTTLVPDRPEPRFWLGLAKEQDGDVDGARAAYQALLAKATETDPWRAMVQSRLDGLKTPGGEK